MKKRAKNTTEDEVKVIIDGLNTIKQGLIDEDLDLVAKGYTHITGEVIEKPKPISKLQAIRKAFEPNTTPPVANTTSDVTSDKSDDGNESEDEETNVAFTEQKIPRPKNAKFGKGELTIISTPANSKEAKQNRKVVVPKDINRDSSIIESIPDANNPKSEEAPVRQYNERPANVGKR